MNKEVWVGPFLGPGGYDDILGAHDKPFGKDWTPAEFIKSARGEEYARLLLRYTRGETLKRTDFPEAAGVFSPEHFARTKDFFALAGFYAVKGKLAEVLSQFDFSAGGLLPFQIFQEDKSTPLSVKYFFLNFGGPKDFLLPEHCRGMQPFIKDKETGRQLWKLGSDFVDDDVAVSTAALSGPDIWTDSGLYSTIFMSHALVVALAKADIRIDFRLRRCRVLDGALS